MKCLFFHVLLSNMSWAFCLRQFDTKSLDAKWKRGMFVQRRERGYAGLTLGNIGKLIYTSFWGANKSKCGAYKQTHTSVHECDMKDVKKKWKEEEKFEHHFISSIWHWLNFFSVNVAYQAVRVHVRICVSRIETVDVLMKRSW